MSNSILQSVGNLDVVNATLRAPKVEVTTSVGVANTSVTETFSVADKFHVDKDSIDPVSITGNVVASGVKISNLTIGPAFDFASVSNVGNVTANVIQFANATTGFTTTANVEIGGNITLTSNAQVKVGSNVLMEYTGPHPREPKEMPLKKYPEILFEEGKFDRNDTTNTYTQGGYTVTTTTDENPDTPAYHAFDNKMFADGDDLNRWQTLNHGYYGSIADTTTGPVTTLANGTSTRGSYIQLESPHKIVVSRYAIWSQENAILFRPKKVILLGSNTGGTDWVSIDPAGEVEPEFVSTGIGSKISIKAIVSFTNTTAYKYHRLVVRATNGATVVLVQELELYGRDESSETVGDLSLDTTLKSTFNSVRSNNYVMYFDGEDPQGSPVVPKYLPSGAAKTITPNNITFDATNNCWSLNGSTESNVTTADLGFEGDAPHTVSMWVNSSNLDANATTQQLFSIGSGYDKSFLRVDDTQIAANTWHNVTYAYQGEGGSKVTYVDGRKVEEVQVEDTFGLYPPFAMTDYEVAGYVLSSDTGHDGTSDIWKAFDHDDSASSAWFSQPGSSDADSSYQAGYARGNPGQSVTDTNGTTHSGSWGKIKFPHKFVLSYVRVHGGTPVADYIPHNPDNYVILGSNDDTNWDLLTTRTGASDSSNGMTAGGTNIDQHAVNATKGYKYIKFMVTKLGSTSGDREFIIASLKLYGHKESDLTRFPEPTKVLKYPHMAMTGPGHRGYVASASSDNNGNNPAYKAFDHSTSDGWSTSGTYQPSGGFGIPTNSPPTLNGTGVPGEYFILQLPHKLRFSSVKLMPRNNNTDRCAESGNIYGSDDGTNWQFITSFSGKTYTSGNFTTIDINASTAYYRFAIVVTRIGNTANGVNTSIGEMELYGTQEDIGTPAIVGGPFAGKVANFRVYDKYLGEERIQEIYDAQKDAFGHKKSSMTFYKGRIGVGTTEPEGALTVVDEPHASEKFPARAVYTNDAYVEGQGRFHFSSSWRGATNQSDSIAYQPFGNSNATFQPAKNEQLSDDVDYGSWMKIESPQAMSLKKAEIGLHQEWFQIGSTFGGGANNHMMGRCVALNKNGTRVAISRTFYTDTLSNQGLVQVFDWNGTSWVQVGNGILGDTANDRLGENDLDFDDEGNTLIVGSKQDGIGSVGGQVDVYYLNGTTWTLKGSSFTVSGGTTEYGSGVAISADGNTIALSEKNANSNAGKVQAFTWSGSAWVQKGSDMVGAAGDEIGSRVNMTPDGNYIITSNENVSSNHGKVWVYKWNGSAWVLRYTQTGTGNDYFGYDVSISDDANVIAIGESVNDDYATDHGAVHIRRWNGTTYAAEQTLFVRPSLGEDPASDYFGSSCKLSGDGTRLVAGSRYVPGTGNDAKGRVFTFEYNGSEWNIRGRGRDELLNYGTEGNQGTTGTGSQVGFLNSVSISRDGSVIGVGMYRDDSYHSDGGAAKIFQMASNVKGIWGSNDDKNWTKITGDSIAVRGKLAGAEQADFTNLDNPNYYKYHAIVYDNFTRVDYANLYGVREKGSSTIHDGTLTLTKNMTVPQIGPALGTDNTPRRDRLVVEYNTTINNTETDIFSSRFVRDTSGRGHHGIMYGGCVYDAHMRGLKFLTAETQYIKSVPLQGFKGNQAHTISFWFTSHSDMSGTWATLGAASGEASYQVSSVNYEESNTRFKLEGWGNDFAVNYTAQLQRCYHIVITYEGGLVTSDTKKMYINGKLQTNFTQISAGSAQNFADNTVVMIGRRIATGQSQGVSGFIRNYKLYDCALTSEEVDVLYEMGKYDEGHHVVNFEKTRVGIGLGDGQAPEALLDVRGPVSLGSPYGGSTVGIGTDLQASYPKDVPLHVFRWAGNAHEKGGGILLERYPGYGGSIWSQYSNRDCLMFRVRGNEEGTYGGTPQMVLTQDGRIGIGESQPISIVDVPISINQVVDVNDYQDGKYFTWNNCCGTVDNEHTVNVSGNFDGGWLVCHGLSAGYGIQVTSDGRIKKDIREIDDGEALAKFRLLKPCKYKYREPLISGRTNQDVYGFIAQEVAEVLPAGVTIGNSNTTKQGYIPNIMSLCDIEKEIINEETYTNLTPNQKLDYIKSSEKDTYVKQIVTIKNSLDLDSVVLATNTKTPGTYQMLDQPKTTSDFDKYTDDEYHPLVFYTNEPKTILTNIIRVIDDSRFIVDTIIDESCVFSDKSILLYGQRPHDFHRLQKDAIFTLTAAALQEVDRQLEAEKVKVTTLETQLASVLTRLDALENA